MDSKICLATPNRIVLPNEYLLLDRLYNGLPPEYIPDFRPYLFVRPGDWPVIDDFLKQPIWVQFMATIGDRRVWVDFHSRMAGPTVVSALSFDDMIRIVTCVRATASDFIGLLENYRQSWGDLPIGQYIQPSGLDGNAQRKIQLSMLAMLHNSMPVKRKREFYRETKEKITTWILATYGSQCAGASSDRLLSATEQVYVNRLLGPNRDWSWVQSTVQDLVGQRYQMIVGMNAMQSKHWPITFVGRTQLLNMPIDQALPSTKIEEFIEIDTARAPITHSGIMREARLDTEDIALLAAAPSDALHHTLVEQVKAENRSGNVSVPPTPNRQQVTSMFDGVDQDSAMIDQSEVRIPVRNQIRFENKRLKRRLKRARRESLAARQSLQNSRHDIVAIEMSGRTARDERAAARDMVRNQMAEPTRVDKSARLPQRRAQRVVQGRTIDRERELSLDIARHAVLNKFGMEPSPETLRARLRSHKTPAIKVEYIDGIEVIILD